MSINRSDIINRLHEKIAKKQPIILGAAGNGLSARLFHFAEVDLILTNGVGDIVLNGHPSVLGAMYYGDANKLNLKVASNGLLKNADTPLVAGLGATDPFRHVNLLMEDLKRMGAAGIWNTPSVCVYDELRRRQLQNGSFGYLQEVDMIRQAHEMGFLTVASVSTANDAELMMEAGADILTVFCGFTVGGLSGANAQTAIPMDEIYSRVQSVCSAVKKSKANTIVVANGGLLNSCENVQLLFDNTDAQGFLGGSAMERLPIEGAVTATVTKLKTLRTNP